MSLISMKKIFNSNRVNSLLPDIDGENKNCLILSLLEHVLLDKGFDVDITTPDVRMASLDIGELSDFIEEDLESDIGRMDINKRIKIYQSSGSNFTIEVY